MKPRLIKHVTAWTTAAAVSSVALAASTALPAAAATSTSAARTKTISYRGMHMTVPSAWKVTNYKSEDLLLVHTKAGCDRKKSVCPAFDVAGPRKIHGSKNPNWIGETYKPGRHPYHPATSVTACRFKGANYGNEVERFPGSYNGKTLVSGHRQVGKGHKAQYYEWAGECYDDKKHRVTRKFVQREWYLPKEKIVIVDGWGTPGLADAIKHATWN